MAATINPAVSGVTYRRWLAHVAAFAVAVFVSAAAVYVVVRALFAIVAGTVGPGAWLAAGGVVLATCVLRDIGVSVPVPYRNVQVPEWVRATLPPGATAFAYGAHLGLGFLTRFTYSTHAAFVLALPFVHGVGLVAAVLAVFALGKIVVLFVAVGRGPFHEFEETYYARIRAPRGGVLALRLANATAAVAVAMAVWGAA